MTVKARAFGDSGKLVSKTTTYVSDQFGGRAAAPEIAHSRPRTVALIGDSFTYGAENDYPDTLQGILDRALPQANVLNFSRSGTSSIYFAATAGAFMKRVHFPIDAALVGIYTDMQIGDVPRVLAAQKSWGRYVVHGADVGAELLSANFGFEDQAGLVHRGGVAARSFVDIQYAGPLSTRERFQRLAEKRLGRREFHQVA